MIKVLVIDDEPQLLRAMRITLNGHGYDVVTAGTAEGGLRAVAEQRPGLVILDLGLPDHDGVEVIERLRAWTRVPVIVLSGRMDIRQKVAALDAGADDYVTKPFSIEELLARVRVATRVHADEERPVSVRIGRHLVDLGARTVRVDDESGQSVHLTKTEWLLLEAIVSRPGRLVSQHQLLVSVWGPAYRAETQYLRQYMAQLRGKLEEVPARPRHLLTEPGMGYRFQT